MEISSYEINPAGGTADVAGTWELTLDFQGQSVKVSMTLDQKDGAVSGSLETILGSGNISEGSVRGNSLRATAVTEIQGQTVDFAISGSVDGDSMRGTLSTAIIPDSLVFEGKRLD